VDCEGWFDLDLPHVIAIRRQLIAETERSTCLACSLFNPEWMSEIGTADRGLFIHAAGVFFYFNEQDIREFFFGLHDRLAGAHIAFDAMRRLALRGTNWVLRKSDVKGVTTKWGLDDPSDMEAWDCGVSVIEWVPLFSGIPRTGFDLWTRALMWANDRFNVAIIVHCSV
jgi:O-methyltransferase involved in polyketide biosynthesis